MECKCIITVDFGSEIFRIRKNAYLLKFGKDVTFMENTTTDFDTGLVVHTPKPYKLEILPVSSVFTKYGLSMPFNFEYAHSLIRGMRVTVPIHSERHVKVPSGTRLFVLHVGVDVDSRLIVNP